MSDIVEQLRAYGGNCEDDYRHRAASEIQRLRAEVERLTRERDEAFERAAQIADVHSVLFEKQAAHTEDALIHDALVMASDACELVACEIRHAGKDGGAACGKPVDGDP